MKKLIDPVQLKDLGKHLVVIVLLAVTAILYFNPLLTGKVLLQSDIQQYKSMSRQIAEQRESNPKEEAYWIDNAFLGMPTYQLGAQYPADFLQPFYYITRVLPRPANLLFLYLLGAYILFSVLGIKRFYASFGAFAFGFSTYLLIILQVGHNTKAEAIGYFPLVLAGFLLLVQDKRLKGWLLSVLALGMQIRANHYQMTYYLLLLLLVMGLVYLWEAYKNKKLPSYFQQMGLFSLAGLLAIGLNATPLLATQEYANYSTRGPSELKVELDGSPKTQAKGLDYEYITQYSYGLFESFSLIFPRIQGGGSREDLGVDSPLYSYLIRAGASRQQAQAFVSSVPTYWGDQPILEAPAYIGISLFFLAIIGFRSSRGPLRKSLLIAIVLSLVLSWGKNIPWFTHFLIDYFPLYNKFRAVSSAQVILELCVPILAIWGFTNFAKKETSERHKILLESSILLGGIVVSMFLFKGMLSFQGPIDSYLRQGYGNEILQQIIVARKAIYTEDLLRALFFCGGIGALLVAWNYQKIKKELALSLIFLLVVADLMQIALRYQNQDLFVRKSVVNNAFTPSSIDQTILQDKSRYRVYDSDAQLSNARTANFHRALGGYHGAKPRRLQEVMDYFRIHRAESILNMLNVKYVLYQEEGEKKVLINPEAQGIAWPVDSLAVVPDAFSELNNLKTIDLSRKATIQSNRMPSDLILPKRIDSTFQIRLKSEKPTDLRYQYQAAESQFVVFSEAFYQNGWKAYIDNEEVPIYRVNYLLRAAWLPSDSSEIRFVFDPPIVRLGTQLRWGTLLLFLICLSGGLFYTKKTSR